MQAICPTCRQPIDSKSINVRTDVAFCARCERAFSLGRLIAEMELDEGEIGTPPEGCWFETAGRDWEVGASMRSSWAWIFVPAAAGLAGGLSLLVGWHAWRGRLEQLPVMDVGFLAMISLPLCGIAAMSVWGHVVLTVRDGRATLFTGIWPVGQRRRFDWSTITRVATGLTSSDGDDTPQECIRLEGAGQRIELGQFLPEERRRFVVQVLRRLVARPRG